MFLSVHCKFAHRTTCSLYNYIMSNYKFSRYIDVVFTSTNSFVSLKKYDYVAIYIIDIKTYDNVALYVLDITNR